MAEPEDSFLTWVRDTYFPGRDLTLLEAPEVLIRFGLPNSVYRQYWEQNIKAKPLEEIAVAPPPPPPPPIEPLEDMEIGGAVPDLPDIILLNGRSVNVAGWQKLTQAELSDGTTVDIWSPILPLNEFTPESAKGSQTSLFFQTDEGFTRIPEQDALALGIDNEEFVNISAYWTFVTQGLESGALTAADFDANNRLVNVDIRDLIAQSTSNLVQGRVVDSERLQSNIERVREFPEFANILRLRGELPVRDPAALGGFVEAGRTRGQELIAATEQLTVGENEIDELEQQIERLGVSATEAQRLIDAGVLDPNRPATLAQQELLSAKTLVDRANERLAQFETGELIPRGITPEASALGREIQVGLREISRTGVRFIDRPEDPEFANLSRQQKARLRTVGEGARSLAKEDEGPTAQEEAEQLRKQRVRKRFGELQEQLRLRANPPQRIGRI